jgi:hypothetical protein
LQTQPLEFETSYHQNEENIMKAINRIENIFNFYFYFSHIGEMLYQKNVDDKNIFQGN